MAYLIVAAVDGSDVQKLTPGLPRTFLANTVRWSADGSLIVFEGPSDEDNIQDIYSINRDGSDFQNLTQTRWVMSGPTFRQMAPDCFWRGAGRQCRYGYRGGECRRERPG